MGKNLNKKEVLKRIKDNTIASNELKKFSKDKQVIIAAVNKNGSNLKLADKQLKADKEVVLEALKNDIDSLKFADKKIIKWFESLSLWDRDQLLGLNKNKDPFGDEEINDEILDDNLTYTLIGEEITYYKKTFNLNDFTNKKKIKKNIQDFITEAESSSGSIPVLGHLDKDSKKIISGKSELMDHESSNIKYEFKNIGDLFKKPPKGKITLIFYYQYLSSEYKIKFNEKQKKILFKINRFNDLALISYDNNDNMEINNESADDATDTYIEVLFYNGKKNNYELEREKFTWIPPEQMIKNLRK